MHLIVLLISVWEVSETTALDHTTNGDTKFTSSMEMVNEGGEIEIYGFLGHQDDQGGQYVILNRTTTDGPAALVAWDIEKDIEIVHLQFPLEMDTARHPKLDYCFILRGSLLPSAPSKHGNDPSKLEEQEGWHFYGFTQPQNIGFLSSPANSGFSWLRRNLKFYQAELSFPVNVLPQKWLSLSSLPEDHVLHTTKLLKMVCAGVPGSGRFVISSFHGGVSPTSSTRYSYSGVLLSRMEEHERHIMRLPSCRDTAQRNHSLGICRCEVAICLLWLPCRRCRQDYKMDDLSDIDGAGGFNDTNEMDIKNNSQSGQSASTLTCDPAGCQRCMTFAFPVSSNGVKHIYCPWYLMPAV